MMLKVDSKYNGEKERRTCGKLKEWKSGTISQKNYRQDKESGMFFHFRGQQAGNPLLI